MSKKITVSEVGALAYILILFNYLGTTSDSIIPLVKQDSWISIILAFIIGIIPLIIFFKIMDYEPNLTIIEKNKVLFGKVFGSILNLILAIFFFISIIYSFWNLISFLGSQYLHRTPPFFIGICTCSCIIYLLSKDITVILKAFFVLFIVGLTLYLLGSITLVEQISLENFKPVLEFGITNPIIGALKNVSYNILPLFLITLIPKNKIKNVDKLGKTIAKFYILCFLIMFFIVIVTIGIYGPKLSMLYQYSAFHLLKKISILGFINRIESTISIRWILYLICFIVIGLYFVLESLKNTFNIKNKIINSILIFLLPLSSLYISENVFQNNVIKEIYAEIYLPIINGIFLFIIPLFILIFSKLKKNNSY